MLTADRLKLSLAVLILAGGIGEYYYLATRPDAIRVVIVLVCAIIAAIVALQTEPGRAAWEFAKGSRLELRKVVWPTRKETVQVTLVVVAMVLATALFLWIVDWALIVAIKALTGQGS
ncbi:MAG: preprotein translocase subunit SecE [Acidiferrobacterales bacterium]